MLPMDSQPAVKGKENGGSEETHLPMQIQIQNTANPSVQGEHISDHDFTLNGKQSDELSGKEFDINDEVSIESEDICLFCWENWKESGIKPSLDASKCLDCERPLCWDACGGRDGYYDLYCQSCAVKYHRGTHQPVKGERGQSHPPGKIDSDEEQDGFSPYHIHT